MSKKGVPIHVLRQKADDYVQQGHIDSGLADRIVLLIEEERGVNKRLINDMDTGGGAPDQAAPGDIDRSVAQLSREQMSAELDDRETKLRSGGTDGQETDQWRCYQHIVARLQSDMPLRLMIQASAGTGKSFLTVEGEPA